MYQAKIFASKDYDVLENEINKFISGITAGNLIDIKYSSQHSISSDTFGSAATPLDYQHSALIIYNK